MTKQPPAKGEEADEPNTDLRRQGLFYLWHLEAIGLFERTLTAPPGPRPNITPIQAWGLPDDATPPTRNAKIALIDNGVSTLSHPNLPCEETFLVHAIDFSGDRRGRVYADPDGIRSEVTEAHIEAALANMRTREGGVHKGENDCPTDQDYSDLVSELKRYAYAPERLPKALDPCQRFAAHGTACAGLIGAGVPWPQDGNSGRKEARADAEHEADRKSRPPRARPPSPFAMPYIGVNPWSQIIPINTVYSPDYWPLIMSMLHAVVHEADVILMPRLVEEMNTEPLQPEPEPPLDGECRDDRHVDAEDDPRWSRLRQNKVREKEKQVFEALLAFVSYYVPVVVAAGNMGRRDLEYPASLVGTKAPQLIVAGAVTARGLKSSYCSGEATGTGAQSISVFAPSDDVETVSADDFRLDDMSWRGRRQHWDDIAAERSNCFSPYGIVAVDIPGEYGYDAHAEEDRDFAEIGANFNSQAKSKEPEYKPRALYTSFGGTSAASAITAGLASLIQHKLTANGKPTLTGHEMKRLLQETGQTGRDMEEEAGIEPPFPQGPEHGHPSPSRVRCAIDAKAALAEIGFE